MDKEQVQVVRFQKMLTTGKGMQPGPQDPEEADKREE